MRAMPQPRSLTASMSMERQSEANPDGSWNFRCDLIDGRSLGSLVLPAEQYIDFGYPDEIMVTLDPVWATTIAGKQGKLDPPRTGVGMRSVKAAEKETSPQSEG